MLPFRTRPARLTRCLMSLMHACMQLTRQARRAYVGNLPARISEAALVGFFNSVLLAAGAATAPGQPVLSAYLNPDKRYAFLELRYAHAWGMHASVHGLHVWMQRSLHGIFVLEGESGRVKAHPAEARHPSEHAQNVDGAAGRMPAYLAAGCALPAGAWRRPPMQWRSTASCAKARRSRCACLQGVRAGWNTTARRVKPVCVCEHSVAHDADFHTVGIACAPDR